MKNQRKRLGWGLLASVFVLVFAAFSVLFSNQTVSAFSASDCDTKYSNNSILADSCKKGIANANTTGWCSAQYSGALKDACEYGWNGVNTGGTTPTTTPSNITTFCANKYPNNDLLIKACEAGGSGGDCTSYNGALKDACTEGQNEAKGVSNPNQNTSGAAGWCASKYPNNDLLIKACEAGGSAANIGNNSFCGSYAGALKDACEAGRDEARSQNPGYVNTTPPITETESDTTCVIPYVGWAICPILLAASKGVDAAYNAVEGILETPVSIFTDADTNGVGEVYGKFLNIANIVLAVCFLVMILAQAVPGFMPNYTIKKYTTKLIIAAVALNTAFYLCAILVDITNIVGRGIPEFFNTLSAQGVTQNASQWNIPGTSGGSTAIGDGFAGFTGSILAGSAVIGGVALVTAGGLAPIGWAIVMFLLPIVLGAIVAIIAILLTLVLRSALIIILIVVSPVAFATLAMPNLDKVFEKWWGLFYKLLLLYPIVALVFGGSKLAGSILMNVATTSSGSFVGAFLAMAASACTILPLILVPGMLKGAVSGLGKIGQKIEGFTDKGFAGAKNTVDKRMKESAQGEYFAGKKANDRTMRKAGVSLKDRRASWRSSGFTQSRAMAGAGALAAEGEKDSKAMTAYLEDFRYDDGSQLSNGDYLNIITGAKTSVGKVKVTDTMRASAFGHIGVAGGASDKIAALKFMGTAEGRSLSQDVHNAAFKALKDDGKTPMLHAKHISNLLNRQFDYEAATTDYIKNALSADSLTSMTAGTAKELMNFANTTNPALLNYLRTARNDILATPTLNARIDSEKRTDVFNKL